MWRKDRPVSRSTVSICGKCGFRTDFTTNQNVTKYDTVTLRTDEREEVDAMNALIQRWASNGWKIKSLSEFHRTESGTGGLTYMLTRYTTILFEKTFDCSGFLRMNLLA